MAGRRTSLRVIVPAPIHSLTDCHFCCFSLLVRSQVLDLGITRMMCHRLILVFPHVCKEFYPEYKDESATARAGNTRTEFLGRRSLASFIPPGYVGHSFLCYFLATFLAQWLLSRTWRPAQPVTDEYSFISFTVYCLFWLCPLFSYLVGPKDKQATFTGRQQRAGVWILAFLVAGLFGPGTRRRPPPKKKARAAATPERRKGRHPESSRSRPARAPRAQTESVDADSEHSETDEDDQDVADLIESLLQSDASCRNQSAGGSDTSGGGSSAAGGGSAAARVGGCGLAWGRRCSVCASGGRGRRWVGRPRPVGRPYGPRRAGGEGGGGEEGGEGMG